MSIIKHVTLQTIVAHDFRYDPRINPMLVGNLEASSLLKSVMISTIKAGYKGCKCLKIKIKTTVYVVYMSH